MNVIGRKCVHACDILGGEGTQSSDHFSKQLPDVGTLITDIAKKKADTQWKSCKIRVERHAPPRGISVLDPQLVEAVDAVLTMLAPMEVKGQLRANAEPRF